MVVAADVRTEGLANLEGSMVAMSSRVTARKMGRVFVRAMTPTGRVGAEAGDGARTLST
jgi:hypothetical protein